MNLRAQLVNVRTPTLLFLFALLIDHAITQRGVNRGYNEGNIVVLWLWETVPGGPHLLAALWAIVIVGASLLLVPTKLHVARWLLFTAFLGHLAGFLSWTPILHEPIQLVWHHFGRAWGLAVILLGCGIGGALLTTLFQKNRTWFRLIAIVLALVVTSGTLLWRNQTPSIRTADDSLLTPPTVTSIDQQQALVIAQSTATKRSFDINAMSFVLIDEQLRHPHFTAQNVLTWGNVTPEEQQANWIVYGFPTAPGQRGGDIMILVNKEAGTVTRVMQGR
jgi:hypothetical protein